MSSIDIHRRGLTLLDVSTQTTEKSITQFIKKHLSNVKWDLQRGKAYCKNGEQYERIYIKFYRPQNVDDFMEQRSFRLNGKPLKVIRTLPKSYLLYDRCVTGLKIKIHTSDNNHTHIGKLNQNDLKKHFQHFRGKITECKWMNTDQTEALFTFSYYDSVDQIILDNPSPEIKGVKVYLEKVQTAADCITYQHPHVIHVTNLPLCVTSEEVSKIFKVPIGVILLHPCFHLERSRVVGGRSSSEAWITNFNDERDAGTLATEKTGTIVGTNRIQCETMLEPINEVELCEHFQKGPCPFMDQCHYKHFTCSEQDRCSNKDCWYGHSDKRTTISNNRPEYRSEDALYRVRLSNLPSNVTREGLMERLKIDSKFSSHLILQPAEHNPGSPRMAYLIRQPLENRLRQQIDKWHNTSFSSISSQKIQCQLELNQEYYEWNDFTDMIRSIDNSRCTSPVLSIQSTHSNGIKPIPWYSSAASTISCRETVSKRLQTFEQSHEVTSIPTYHSNVSKKKRITNSLRTISGTGSRRLPPSDMTSLSTQWYWTNQMIPKDRFDHGELYWVEDKTMKEKNVVIKIYLPQTDPITRIRAQRERVALEHLKQLRFVPKLFHNNIDSVSGDQLSNELWIVMRLIDAERLSDYIKSNKLDLREALQITRQLLTIIKQIHAHNVIHRDIQPKNILLRHRPSNDEIDLSLMNFSSAWINNHQLTNSLDNIDDQLGNHFYRMPQFEKSSDENNEQLSEFRHNPNIDTTGICAILFWLITNHEPKESQNISGQTPHKLHDNSKIIEKKINEITAFRTDMKIHEHLMKHLTLIFDRGFAGPKQQWSVDELDYQLQFLIQLIANENEQINYFPAPSKMNDDMSTISIPSEDPFVYTVSLIHHLKHQFAARYSKCVRWSTEKRNNWKMEDGRIENYDLLTFSYQGKDLAVNIELEAEILKEQPVLFYVKAKTHNNIVIELPLRIWKINEQTTDFEVHLKKFEMEIKTLINILFKSIT